MTSSKKNLGKGFARRVTSDNLDILRHLLRAAPNKGEAGTQSDSAAKPTSEPSLEVAAALAMFSGDSVKVPKSFSPLSPTSASSNHAAAAVAPHQAPTPGVSQSGSVALRGLTPVWKKTLSLTDAQRQTGHPTGDLRLMKAGHKIDQTKFFRYQVFGKLVWSMQPDGHEEASGTFDVTILGRRHGTLVLTLSHRPDGHAGQQNYTTGLRWGSLTRLLRTQVDVTQKELRLYALPPGGSSDFAIEIG